MDIMSSVLIVESDLKVMEMLSSLLSLQRMKVLKSYSIREALVKSDRQKFSLILLSTQFIGEHYEDLLLATDVADSINNKTPIVLLPESPEEDIFQNFQNRILSVLPKPYDPLQLLRLVTKVVHG